MRPGKIVLAILLVMVSAAPALAAEKRGCPVADGWEQLTVEEAAERVWPELLDQSPWLDQEDFQESAVRPHDRNGDGSICLRTIWDDLNPNSMWHGVLMFLPRDNSANASNL